MMSVIEALSGQPAPAAAPAEKPQKDKLGLWRGKDGKFKAAPDKHAPVLDALTRKA